VSEAADDLRTTLDVYLLGRVGFDELLALQRRLVFEISGDRGRACLLLCEHDSLISVGRHGSRSQIQFDHGELNARGWPVRWVNRGGGCLLHAPGQLAVYPILPLDRLGLDLPAYLAALRAMLLDVTSDAGVKGAVAEPSGAAVAGRPVARIGIAVRDWVSYFGATLNVNPDLEPFRRIRESDRDSPMTSLERERRLAINPALVSQRIVERFMEHFHLPRVAVFHGHPSLPASRSTFAPLPHLEADLMLRSLTGADAPDY